MTTTKQLLVSSSVDFWFSRWQNATIPVLESTHHKLQALKGQGENIRPNQVARIVLKDPMFTIQVIRFVNNKPRGRYASEVTLIENVVLLFGIDRFIDQFSQLPTLESKFPNQVWVIEQYSKLLNRALLSARLALEWGKVRQDAKAEELYVGSLCFYLPSFLTICDPDVAIAIKRGQNKWDKNRFRISDMPFIEISRRLCQKWLIPESLQELFFYDEEIRSRALCVKQAIELSEALEGGWFSTHVLTLLDETEATLRVESGEVWQRVTRILLKIGHEAGETEFKTAASWLAYLPGTWPEDELLPSPKPQVHVELNPEVNRVNDVELARISSLIQDHLDGSFGFNQMMKLVMEGLIKGVGCERVVFALLGVGLDQLKAKYVVGQQEGDRLSTFLVDLSQPSLFKKLMEKPQALWLNEQNAKQFEVYLPRHFRSMIGEGDFMLMSIFIHDKPVGVLYGDCRSQFQTLTLSQFTAFKNFCLLAAQGLSHLAQKK